MQADDHAVEVILSEARRFMVPLYQRKYQWADRRLDPFWEDVEAKAVEVLEGSSKFQHYLGALILSPLGEAGQIAVTPKVQVVDGQQRLTTFQLFLAALREVARKHDHDDLIKHVHGYLFNQPKSKDTDPLTRFKLTPTPSDREVFQDIIEKRYREISIKYVGYYWGSGVPKNTPLRALRAYEVFFQKIQHFALYGPTEPIIEEDEDDAIISDETDTKDATYSRLEALLTAILNRMKLVVIILGEGDDAQVIFETLNSKGEPLLAMDLVRNNIFHRAEKEEATVEDLYKELWDPFDGAWWREAAPFARPKRPRIDHFLAHVLAAETGEKISMRELYAEYRAFAVPKGRPRFDRVEDELRVLQHYAPLYETLEGKADANSTLSWLGRKFAAWQLTTAYPIALQLAQDGVEPDEREAIAKLIYSYIVRRSLSGLTSKNLNRVFQAIAQIFSRELPSVTLLRSYFSERTGNSTRFPDNREFRRGILEKPAYQLAPQTRIKDILWELELASRSKLAEGTGMPTGLWTEHVLPLSWNEEWPFPDGRFVERWSGEPKADERDRLLHTLGNLTLLSGGLNISSGNKSFEEKKAKYEKHTGLFLNKWFVKKEAWTEDDIRERGEQLADLAVDIWIDLGDSRQ